MAATALVVVDMQNDFPAPKAVFCARGVDRTPSYGDAAWVEVLTTGHFREALVCP